MAEKRPQFETVKTNPVIRIGNTNYFMSIQKIESDSGNTSEHFVLKKQGINSDGSLRGQTRQIFILKEDAQELLQSAVAFITA